MTSPTEPRREAELRERFAEAAFVADIGIELDELGDGWAQTRLAVAPRHMQAQRFVHAGVLATMADHTAGAAAWTLVGAQGAVVTVEYKVNFLRPAVAQVLVCRAVTLRGGRQLSVVESKVFAEGAPERPFAAAMLTMAMLAPQPGT